MNNYQHYCYNCNKEIDTGNVCKKCEEDEKARVLSHYEELIVPWLKTIEGIGIKNVMFVWKFHEAPWGFQMLSMNGGDEDWIVYVPQDVTFDYRPLWIDRMDNCENPDEFHLPNGSRVFIGCHG